MLSNVLFDITVMDEKGEMHYMMCLYLKYYRIDSDFPTIRSTFNPLLAFSKNLSISLIDSYER